MRLSGRHIRLCAGRPRGVLRPRFRGRRRARRWPWSARNGSGKTSLLRLIAGLLAPAGGSIALEGGEAELTLPEQSHYLGHRDALKPALSVDGKPVVLAGFSRRRRRRHRRNASQAVGLGHATHLPAAFLSAGQRRRLSIARLLAVRRPVWLLDEPTSALDTAGQATVRRPDARPSRRAAASSSPPPTPRSGSRRGNCGSGARHDRPRRADSTRHPDRAARRRRRADRRAVLPHRRRC